MKLRLLASLFVASCLAGCPSDPVEGEDTGGGGMDVGPVDAFIPIGTDAPIPIPDTPGVCVPRIEICGDRMDQNCDGRDTSCGDSDGDSVEACRVGDDLRICDCDDSRANVYPPTGGGAVPGGAELCDGVDNNCNGRIDESAECCAGCMALGAESNRGDICDATTGECECSTEPGTGICPAGETCCTAGCVNTDTDITNCGLCGARCTDQADNCQPDATGMGVCRCGDGPVCDFINVCTGGSC